MTKILRCLWFYLFVFVQLYRVDLYADSSTPTPSATGTVVDLYSRDHRYCAMKQNSCGTCVNAKAGEERNTCYQSLEDNYMQQSTTFNDDPSTGETFIYYSMMAYNIITMTSIAICPTTAIFPGAFVAFAAGTTWYIGESKTNKSLKKQLETVKTELATFKKIGNLRSEKDVEKKWAKTPVAAASAQATANAAAGLSDDDIQKSSAKDEYETQMDFYKMLSDNLNEIRDILTKKQDIFHAVMGLYYSAFALSIVDLPLSLITCTGPSAAATIGLSLATGYFCSAPNETPAYTAAASSTPTPGATPTMVSHDANYDSIAGMFIGIVDDLGINSMSSLCVLSAYLTDIYAIFTAGVTVPLGRAAVYLSIAIIVTVAADTYLQNKINTVNDRKHYVDDLITAIKSNSTKATTITTGNYQAPVAPPPSQGGGSNGPIQSQPGTGFQDQAQSCTCNGRPDPTCAMPASSCAERSGPSAVKVATTNGGVNGVSSASFGATYGSGVNDMVQSSLDQYAQVSKGVPNRNALNETAARTMVNAYRMQKFGETNLKKNDPKGYAEFKAKIKDGAVLFKDARAVYAKATKNVDEKSLFSGLSLQGLSVPGIIEDKTKKEAPVKSSRDKIEQGSVGASAPGPIAGGFVLPKDSSINSNDRVVPNVDISKVKGNVDTNSVNTKGSSSIWNILNSRYRQKLIEWYKGK